MADTALIVVCMVLVGIQVGIYASLLAFTMCRMIIAIKNKNPFMIVFYSLTFMYATCELAIQIYQLVTIIIYQRPEDNASLVLAMNIFCIILDLHILIMLNLYWHTIQGSFAESMDYSPQQTNSWITLKMIPTLCWLLIYSIYFVYLCSSKHLTINNQGITENSTISVLLYIVCQSISGFLLLLCVLWQAFGWCRLENTIQNFRRIISLNMNTKRIKGIFWGTAVFNFFRTLFIAVLIVWAKIQNFKYLIIGLNAFTLTAIVPIIFYLFGFKVDPESNSKDILIRPRNTQSSSSKKNSSNHQTQLSHQSYKEQVH